MRGSSHKILPHYIHVPLATFGPPNSANPAWAFRAFFGVITLIMRPGWKFFLTVAWLSPVMFP